MTTAGNGKRTLILVVDDEPANVDLLESILAAEGYATILSLSGEDALAKAAREQPDLILLDARMPGIDGFETVARLKLDPRTKPVPVMMVTALDDRESKLRALGAGAEEFVSKPIDVAEIVVRVRNLLRLKEYGDFLLNHNHILEEQVRSRTEQLESAYRETVFTLLRAAEHKDEETGLHIRRIGQYCRELAQDMGMSNDFVDEIYQASPMHDVGKIGIPDDILLKPAPLTSEEWAVMRTHCRIGSSILAESDSPYLRMGSAIALHHHERWDGSGYPAGLRGEEIPLPARIMQICDVYDALRSRRPYKEPLEHDEAVRIIREGDRRTSPAHFDPNVLGHFLKMRGRFAEIYKARPDR